MKRLLSAAAMFTLMAVSIAMAEDPKPAVQPAQPPGGKGAKGDNPFGTAATRVTALKMVTLEEEFETIEAHRDVRKAFVKAAEVTVKIAQVGADRLARVAGTGVASKEEVEKAKLEVEAAMAQLEIRIAEMKEIEVKVKFAKKRLEEAKAVGVRPVVNPVVRPPVDPIPPPAPPADVDPKVVAELKAKLAKLAAEVEAQTAEVKKADEAAKLAATEFEKIKDIAMRGRVLPGTIEKAEAKAKEAQAAADGAKAKAKKLDEEVAAVKAKLKEIEK